MIGSSIILSPLLSNSSHLSLHIYITLRNWFLKGYNIHFVSPLSPSHNQLCCSNSTKILINKPKIDAWPTIIPQSNLFILESILSSLLKILSWLFVSFVNEMSVRWGFQHACSIHLWFHLHPYYTTPSLNKNDNDAINQPVMLITHAIK